MPVADVDFEQVVKTHHLMLYRFALSLTRREADALDLTQQTFYLWAKRGQQLRDPTKVKPWLFTTLYREFLGVRRRARQHAVFSLDIVADELPHVVPDAVDQMDADTVMEALMEVDDIYRVPVLLFYLDDCAYKEISALLGVPIGTVMSRIARGKDQLRRLLADRVLCEPNHLKPEAKE
jgi:RNA polymerase sigma-70 factor (ECF subfamily)